MSTYDIYGIGAALVDTEIDVSDEDLQQFGVEKGLMTLVDEDRQQTLVNLLEDHLVHSSRASGGSAANTIIGASYFGSSTFYSCKVASDENGIFFLEDLKQAQVGTHQRNGQSQGVTGKCLVMITPDSERTMNTFLGASETLSKADVDENALKNARYAYIEGYLVTSETGREAAITVREVAQQHGVRVALTLSDPAIAEHFSDGLREMIGAGVHLIFCNEDEARAFTGTNTLEQACEVLLKVCDCFAITRGAKGALVFDGDTYSEVPGYEVAAVDTNGAGDMFAGAFLHAISEG